jgi:hypothetical protein
MSHSHESRRALSGICAAALAPLAPRDILPA